MTRHPRLLLLLLTTHILAQTPVPRYLTFPEAREIIAAFSASGAPIPDLPDSTSWPAWISTTDHDIRARVDRGFEDSISNLILFGTSFTTLPRLAGTDDALNPSDDLTPAAQARIRAFVTALAHPNKNERLQFAATFLSRHGIGTTLLETNLLRFVKEQRTYHATLDAASQNPDPGQLLFTRSTLYHERGLSVDTSLLPNYALEDTLRALLRKGALKPASIHRIAIIGPGLDFADKRAGYDYYPLQTIQPFAILEAVTRLSLATPDPLELTAFDLNLAVLTHIKEAAGHPYTIQLPRPTQDDLNPAALAYWQHFGDVIGKSIPPIPPPPSLKSAILSRAVSIPPRYATHFSAVNLDIVAQTLDPPAGAGFDLVIATNILVYYDLFHQALAKAAIARLLNPGGLLLVNHALPSQPASLLEYLGRRSVSYSPTAGDDVAVYRRLMEPRP